MKPELEKRLSTCKCAIAAQKERAADMDIIIAAIAAMPPGQQNKVLTDEVMAVLSKYGVE